MWYIWEVGREAGGKTQTNVCGEEWVVETLEGAVTAECGEMDDGQREAVGFRGTLEWPRCKLELRKVRPWASKHGDCTDYFPGNKQEEIRNKREKQSIFWETILSIRVSHLKTHSLTKWCSSTYSVSHLHSCQQNCLRKGLLWGSYFQAKGNNGRKHQE